MLSGHAGQIGNKEKGREKKEREREKDHYNKAFYLFRKRKGRAHRTKDRLHVSERDGMPERDETIRNFAVYMHTCYHK